MGNGQDIISSTGETRSFSPDSEEVALIRVAFDAFNILLSQVGRSSEIDLNLPNFGPDFLPEE